MILSDTPSPTEAIMSAERPAADGRAPRLLIAGEFSSGKTALINAILGEPLLPSAVTATSMPPVWLAYGEPGAEIHFLDGRVLTFDTVDGMIAEAGRHAVGDILIARVHSRAPALIGLDLIDTPGSSDPNIPAECWERVRVFADLILWCSNATQAWRQSEKSSWMDVPEPMARRSVLVLTHADRLDADSRAKVLRRVHRDAAPLFRDILVASVFEPDSVRAVVERVRAVAGGIGSDLPSEAAARIDLAPAVGGVGTPPVETVEVQPRRVQPRRVRAVPSEAQDAAGVPAGPDAEAATAAPAASVEPGAHADVDRSPEAPAPEGPITAMTHAADPVEDKAPTVGAEPMPDLPLALAKPRQVSPDRTLWVVQGGAGAEAEPEADTGHDALLERLATLAAEAGTAASNATHEPSHEPTLELVPAPVPAPVPEPAPDPVVAAAPFAIEPVAVDPDPVEPEPHPQLDQPFGPAAFAWGRIDGTFDAEDPAAWADAVVRLIDDLDGALATAWLRHHATSPLPARADRAAQR